MWIHALFPESNTEGVGGVSIIAKETWEIAPGKIDLSDKKIPIFTTDIIEPPDDLLYSETMSESDLTGYKQSTDVIITGKACAPAGKKAYRLLCRAQIGPLKKAILVYGNRTVKSNFFLSLSISDPVPFTEKPIGYRNAYGGVSRTADGILHSYYPNPIGKGFTIKGSFKNLSSIALPSQEDPDALLSGDKLILSKPSDWIHAPKPVSLGWTKRSFYPRFTYAAAQSNHSELIGDKKEKNSTNVDGTESQNELHLGAKPKHLFSQGASEGLFGIKLTGGEHVLLENLDSQYSVYEFTLPNNVPVMVANTGAVSIEPPPELQTVVIDMECKILTMVWRAFIKDVGVEELSWNRRFQYHVY